MKMTKWIASIAVIALVSSSAMAANVHGIETYNWEFGTLYSVRDDQGNLVPDVYNADGDFTVTDDLSDLATPGAWAYRPTELADDEDTWGIAVMYQMKKSAALTPDGLQVSKGGTTIFNAEFDNKGYQIVGMFHGGKDKFVEILSDGSVRINAEDLKIELWAVDNNVLPDTNPSTTPGLPDIASLAVPDGLAGTNRVADNLYTGLIQQDWIDNGDARLLIEAKANYSGFGGPAGGIVGSSTVYLSIDSTVNSSYDGLWNSTWDSNLFNLGGNVGVIPNAISSEIDNLIDADETADIWLQYGLQAPTTEFDGDFQIVSIDAGGFGAIPEPMTMLAFGLGIGGIGSYIRKRRNA